MTPVVLVSRNVHQRQPACFCGIALASMTTMRVEEALRHRQSRDSRWDLWPLRLERMQGWKEMHDTCCVESLSLMLQNPADQYLGERDLLVTDWALPHVARALHDTSGRNLNRNRRQVASLFVVSFGNPLNGTPPVASAWTICQPIIIISRQHNNPNLFRLC